MTRFLAVVLLLATATAAPAAMRTYSVIGFQKIEVSGPYKVIVRTGPGKMERFRAGEVTLRRDPTPAA